MVTYRLVIASDDQIFISPSSYCALIKRMYNSHVRYLLKSKQTTFMELHAVTAIWSNANHSPDNKCYLKDKTSSLLIGSIHFTQLKKNKKDNCQRIKLPKMFHQWGEHINWFFHLWAKPVLFLTRYYMQIGKSHKC